MQEPIYSTYTIWEACNKYPPYPMIPVVIRNSFQGGVVGVDGLNRSAPYHAIWSVSDEQEAHALSAISPQRYYGRTYYYVCWSDGGAQTHDVTPSIDTFGATFTANMTDQPRFSSGEHDGLNSYPNPFNPTTAVRYQLPLTGHVRLAVFDILGREVATLVNEQKGPGFYEVKLDGSPLSGGVYFTRLTVHPEDGSRVIVHTRKVVLAE